MPMLALKFISGKYKGGEYVLPDKGEILIGRRSDIDLVLMEDMVSRQHARISIEGKTIRIQDLGSTNGTFVNGEKITNAVVNRGDRILIGTSIMKIVESDKRPRKTKAGVMPPPRPDSEISGSGLDGGRSMTGTLRDVPLPDLTQLFSTSKKTGTLVIINDGIEGKIHLDKGKLVFASVSDAPGLNPLKAVFRLLSWQDGTFELRGPEQREFPETLDMPTEHILMEGLRQLDEIKSVMSMLPPLETELIIATPLMPKLSQLTKDELDLIQLIYNYGTVRDVLDRTAASSSDAAKKIIELIKKNYITQL
jgi:hypothetical protein